MNEVKEFDISFMRERKSSLYICAAGFEDRVRGVLEKLKDLNERMFEYSLILEYSVHKEDNKKNLEELTVNLPKISHHLMNNAIVDIDNFYKTKYNIMEVFRKVDQNKIKSVFIDISGMANSLILLIISQVKKIFWEKEIIILYTEADIYYPPKEKKDEILRLIKSEEEVDILKLGDELGASGAREVMILPDFKGRFDPSKPICLIFFIGYEPSRAAGLLESYRPNLVVACYGKSPHEKFKWRTDFSRELHQHVLNEFEHFERYISTFEVSEIVEELEEIYRSTDEHGNLLYDYYNIALTPQCSKLQTVASYLFCQKHPDIQIVFCFPGRFNPKRYSQGIGKTWIYL
ncbi:MAG: hypothetical protein ACTSYF_14475, partial [Promethearchaeota archaeon]